MDVLEARITPATDFGDAPLSYDTLLADDGARHEILGPFLGSLVDGESDGQPAINADGDDTNASDDEDGVIFAGDLTVTIGTTPIVNIRATNTSGNAATLYGWIDYNNDGAFDNATERASIAVPDGSNNDIFSVSFPQVPEGFTGKTYARFRISTDVAAANSTGSATDGEVEDYRVFFTAPSDGSVKSTG